jgi:hypothetical protein
MLKPSFQKFLLSLPSSFFNQFLNLEIVQQIRAKAIELHQYRSYQM